MTTRSHAVESVLASNINLLLECRMMIGVLNQVSANSYLPRSLSLGNAEVDLLLCLAQSGSPTVVDEIMKVMKSSLDVAMRIPGLNVAFDAVAFLETCATQSSKVETAKKAINLLTYPLEKHGTTDATGDSENLAVACLQALSRIGESQKKSSQTAPSSNAPSSKRLRSSSVEMF
jgi:hypothetical protein